MSDPLSAAIVVGGLCVVAISLILIKLQKRSEKFELPKALSGEKSGLEGYRGKVESLLQREGSVNPRRGKCLIRGEVWDFECKESLEIGDLVNVDQVVGMTVYVSKTI